MLSGLATRVLDVSRTREEIAVLMKRHRHDPIGAVERLLHAVAVVDVYINVQDAGMVLE
eukprot:evm.model.NODE_30402_length_3421_cov_4.555686.1